MADWRAQLADDVYNGFEVTQQLTKADAENFEAVVRRQYMLQERGNVNVRYAELHVHPSVELTLKEELTLDGRVWVIETIDPYYYSNRVIISYRGATA